MTPSDFRPTASIDNLRRRAAVINDVRRFFEDRGFFHVETPVLSNDIVVDRYLNPLSVVKSKITATKNDADQMWLQTSPEFSMKRLIAAGATAIFQITRAFRSRERGRLHNPEFTMLEWYRVGDSMNEAMQLLGELAESILNRSQTENLSYQTAFERHAGINPHVATEEELSDVAKGQGIEIDLNSTPPDRDGWLNLILTHLVEPNLGRSAPTIIYDWPATQSALAMIRDGNPPLAERFELYVEGLELANGYHELLDPDELRDRVAENNRLRLSDGNVPLPANSRLLQAMEHGLPDCCGVALGLDRLVMIALDAQSIDEVIAFPIEIA